MAERKLGRGLDMLISKAPAAKGVEVLQLDPKSVDPNPEQPRKKFSRAELEMLKSSIARDGMLQPILVRKAGDRYQLVAGERRLRAVQDLGLDNVPALLLPAADDRMLELALIENIQREDLNPVEIARAFQQVMNMKGWTQEALAQAIGLSRSTVANLVRLLELAHDIQDALARGHITLGHAKVLLSVTDPKEQRLLFEKIAEEKLTVRDLEGERLSLDQGAAGPEKDAKQRQTKKKRKAPQIASLEEELSQRLGTKVTIHEGRGKGRITIEFYNPDDFERIQGILLAGTQGA